MKKLLLLILFASYSFAVNDILYKPVKLIDENITKTLYSVVPGYPEELTSTMDEDDKNIFLYRGHFRVIYGIAYKDSILTQNLANTILDIAQTVWSKEIDELTFKAPKNSDRYYIDIYIGNKSAYNKDTSRYVNISNSYAGYATTYSNGTPYFVINPDLETAILKVTIAHEFFHAIQYAYGLGDVSDDIWYKNIWFLEATAVMIEDEVFDDVDDYVNYLRYYVNSTNRSIEYYNSGIEYGKVIFAKYLREKYGIGFIKSFFENYELDKTILEVIEKEFADINSSFKSAMLEFATWMVNKDLYFEEGSLYPTVSRHSIDENLSIGNYGFALFESGATRYLVSSNPEYLQSNFNGQQNVIDSVDLNGLVFLNPKSSTIYTDITQKNKFSGITLKSGWNLISNILDENVTLETIFSDDEVVWIYRDGDYFAYSANSDVKQVIEDNDMAVPRNAVMPGEGMWVFTKNDKIIDFDKSGLFGFNLNLTSGWSILSIASSAFDVDEIDEPVVIWHFSKDTQNWEFYTNQTDIDLPYEKIDKILPGNGYFVRRN